MGPDRRAREADGVRSVSRYEEGEAVVRTGTGGCHEDDRAVLVELRRSTRQRPAVPQHHEPASRRKRGEQRGVREGQALHGHGPSACGCSVHGRLRRPWLDAWWGVRKRKALLRRLSAHGDADVDRAKAGRRNAAKAGVVVARRNHGRAGPASHVDARHQRSAQVRTSQSEVEATPGVREGGSRDREQRRPRIRHGFLRGESGAGEGRIRRRESVLPPTLTDDQSEC